MNIKIYMYFIFVLLFLSLINFVGAQLEEVDVGNLKRVAVSIHSFELILALFIAYMALKFFKITKPINLFMYLYIAIGFFIINTLLYLFLYLSLNTNFQVNFVNVYVGSRISLTLMLISFVLFFYQWNKAMRNAT